MISVSHPQQHYSLSRVSFFLIDKTLVLKKMYDLSYLLGEKKLPSMALKDQDHNLNQKAYKIHHAITFRHIRQKLCSKVNIGCETIYFCILKLKSLSFKQPGNSQPFDDNLSFHHKKPMNNHVLLLLCI